MTAAATALAICGVWILVSAIIGNLADMKDRTAGELDRVGRELERIQRRPPTAVAAIRGVTYPDAPCPRCGKEPVDVQTMSSAEARHLPTCSCYPHPPLCVGCRSPLVGERCESLDPVCSFHGILQPLPDVDPLWDQVTR